MYGARGKWDSGRRTPLEVGDQPGPGREDPDPGALFLLSRSVGIMAHTHEEQARMRPRRYIQPISGEYDDPAERK